MRSAEQLTGYIQINDIYIYDEAACVIKPSSKDLSVALENAGMVLSFIQHM